jgi:hypothetical protein
MRKEARPQAVSDCHETEKIPKDRDRRILIRNRLGIPTLTTALKLDIPGGRPALHVDLLSTSKILSRRKKRGGAHWGPRTLIDQQLDGFLNKQQEYSADDHKAIVKALTDGLQSSDRTEVRGLHPRSRSREGRGG